MCYALFLVCCLTSHYYLEKSTFFRPVWLFLIQHLLFLTYYGRKLQVDLGFMDHRCASRPIWESSDLHPNGSVPLGHWDLLYLNWIGCATLTAY